MLLRLAAPAALGCLLAVSSPALGSTIVFTTTGLVTLGTDTGTFGVGTPDNPASLAGYAYQVTQRFPLADVSSTGNSGPAFDDQFAYFSPGGSADISINNVTVTLTFGYAPAVANYFGVENGLDAGPRPNLRDVIYGQQATYMTGAPIVLQFVQQQVLSTTLNLIDSADLQQNRSVSFAPNPDSTVVIWDYDAALAVYRLDFAGQPSTVTLTTLVEVTIPEPAALALLLPGMLAIGAAARRRAGQGAAAP